MPSKGLKDADYIGKRFGRLVVLDNPVKRSNKAYCLCQCDCGNRKEVCLYSLLRGAVVSCGCYHKEISSEAKTDLTGKRFGRYTVIERVKGYPHRGTYWRCRCECGEERTVEGKSLTSGRSKSCGCFKSDQSQDDIYGKLGLKDSTNVSLIKTNKARSDSSTGVRGVIRRQDGKYIAVLTIKGVRHAQYGFTSIDDAEKARREMWEEFVLPYLQEIGEV